MRVMSLYSGHRMKCFTVKTYTELLLNGKTIAALQIGLCLNRGVYDAEQVAMLPIFYACIVIKHT